METMDVRLLTLPQVRDVYRQHIIRDFPADECKPLFAIERAMERGEYLCFGAFREDTLLAYAFFVALDGDYLFDYLAVCQGLRGQGIGSRFLQTLMRGPLREAACVLLEIDDPDHAEDAEARALRLRRERFYLRNGLTHTGVTAYVFHVHYKILELPICPPHARQEVGDIYRRLYHAIMPEWTYRKMVEVDAED